MRGHAAAWRYPATHAPSTPRSPSARHAAPANSRRPLPPSVAARGQPARSEPSDTAAPHLPQRKKRFTSALSCKAPGTALLGDSGCWRCWCWSFCCRCCCGAGGSGAGHSRGRAFRCCCSCCMAFRTPCCWGGGGAGGPCLGALAAAVEAVGVAAGAAAASCSTSKRLLRGMVGVEKRTAGTVRERAGKGRAATGAQGFLGSFMGVERRHRPSSPVPPLSGAPRCRSAGRAA